MVNTEKIKSVIYQFQKQILDDIKPYIIDMKADFDVSKWCLSANEISIHNHNKKIVISSECTKSQYISYLEKNNSYNVLPKNNLKVIPEEAFEINCYGEVFGKMKVELVIVEYSATEKLRTHIIEINKCSKIKTSSLSDKIRIAFRVSGKGLASLNDLSIRRVKSKQTETTKLVPINSNNKKKTPPKSINELKIAGILDEFTMTCLQKNSQLISFGPGNWMDTLELNHPDILFVESAWKGNYGAWQYKIAKYNNQDNQTLNDLVTWCKDHGIPTVFWNKEDPIHFDKFIESAKLFDFIFTTDANMLTKYYDVVNHKQVFAMPFSAEPTIHNPIKINDNRINKIVFAGSYYANRHKERCSDMDNALEVASEFGLDIYDRNYEENMKSRTQFSFPERFSDNIIGTLRYGEINKAYKGYRVMLNVNTVKNSPTMFSRRVFEALACGTPIISTNSLGIKLLFNNIVCNSDNNEVMQSHIGRLMNDDGYYRQISLEGIREVFLNHTYKHRIIEMLEKIGFQMEFNYPEVVVISIVSSVEEFRRVINSFENQTWRHKKLVLFLDSFDGYIDILNNYNNGNITTFVYSYMKQYSRLDEIISDEYISYFCPGDYYGENYLQDLAIAIEYSQADVVGKSNSYRANPFTNELEESNQGFEYIYVDDLSINSSIVSKKVFNGEDIWNALNKIKIGLTLHTYFKKGAKLFSSDKFNYIKEGLLLSEEDYKKVEK